MKIKLVDDEKTRKEIQAALERNSGYCPCRIVKNFDTKCMCREFREQLQDPAFEGYCHCMLYYKSLKDD